MTDPDILAKEMKIAEALFGTETDPDQMPVSLGSKEKLDSLCDGWLQTKLDEKGEPISWVVVMPTTRALADRFLRKEITERELGELTMPQKEYDALYLMSFITVPQHQRQGLATELAQKAIAAVPLTDTALLFAWPTTKEGELVLGKLEAVLGKDILTRI